MCRSACHGTVEKIIGQLNEDDFKTAISELMIGRTKEQNEIIQPLIAKINNNLSEGAATDLFEFIQQCFRKNY